MWNSARRWRVVNSRPRSSASLNTAQAIGGLITLCNANGPE